MTFQRDTEVYRGDIFYIATGGYVGSEQKAGRPGIIVSNDTANKHSPNVEVVFLTSQEKKPLPTHTLKWSAKYPPLPSVRTFRPWQRNGLVTLSAPAPPQK